MPDFSKTSFRGAGGFCDEHRLVAMNAFDKLGVSSGGYA